MMTLVHTLAVAEYLNFRHAANALGVSLSSVSARVKTLEQDLGVLLFERHARGMRATPAGQALTDAARGVMSELEDVAETLAAIRLGASAALRLGSIPAAAHVILGPLLARFYVRHPQVHVDVQEGEGARLLPLLIAGALDAVFEVMVRSGRSALVVFPTVRELQRWF